MSPSWPGIPTQLVNDRIFSFKLKASRSWRLGIALYVKAGGVRWKLAPLSGVPDATAYIGLAYALREDPKEARFVTCLFKSGQSDPHTQGVCSAAIPFPAWNTAICTATFTKVPAPASEKQEWSFGPGGKRYVRFALIENEQWIAQAPRGTSTLWASSPTTMPSLICTCALMNNWKAVHSRSYTRKGSKCSESPPLITPTIGRQQPTRSSKRMPP